MRLILFMAVVTALSLGVVAGLFIGGGASGDGSGQQASEVAMYREMLNAQQRTAQENQEDLLKECEAYERLLNHLYDEEDQEWRDIDAAIMRLEERLATRGQIIAKIDAYFEQIALRDYENPDAVRRLLGLTDAEIVEWQRWLDERAQRENRGE